MYNSQLKSTDDEKRPGRKGLKKRDATQRNKLFSSQKKPNGEREKINVNWILAAYEWNIKNINTRRPTTHTKYTAHYMPKKKIRRRLEAASSMWGFLRLFVSERGEPHTKNTQNKINASRNYYRKKSREREKRMSRCTTAENLRNMSQSRCDHLAIQEPKVSSAYIWIWCVDT